jgi:hypothetical protein
MESQSADIGKVKKRLNNLFYNFLYVHLSIGMESFLFSSVMDFITPLSQLVGDNPGGERRRKNVVLLSTLTKEIPILLAETSHLVDSRNVKGVVVHVRDKETA